MVCLHSLNVRPWTMQNALHNFSKLITPRYSIDDLDKNFPRYPDSGPLDIESNGGFLSAAKIFFYARWKKTIISKEKLEDYKLLRSIASGSFGNVVLAQNLSNDKLFAMKIIPKEKIVKQHQVNHTFNEKNVLQALNSPMTVYLVSYFLDNSYLYFIMPFIAGGDLFDYLLKKKLIDESNVQFYLAQVILAIEYLHHLELVYRDLKPENILIDHTGYLKLTDFGFCKQLKRGRTYTLCGTPQYLAPEVILNKGYGMAVDWWAIGVLAYELTAGRPPFDSRETMRIYEKILKCSYNMGVGFSDDLKDLISNLLQTDLTKRYGNIRGGCDTIKNHKWFKTINWLSVLNRKTPPSYVPSQKKESDIQKPNETPFKPPVIDAENKYEKEFAIFF